MEYKIDFSNSREVEEWANKELSQFSENNREAFIKLFNDYMLYGGYQYKIVDGKITML